MSSAEPLLNPAEAAELLQVARAAIRHGLEQGGALPLERAAFPPPLRAVRACFVSLHRGSELRGCIGTLSPRDALVEEVAHAAWSAASRDPRMRPVSLEELPALHVSISVLTPSTEVPVDSESALLEQVVPGRDGLTVREGETCGTLLPVVWEAITDPLEFVRTVKQKAGLPPDYWSSSIRWERYGAEIYEEGAE